MTTIAYDGTSIAGDSLETFGHGERLPHPVKKIARCSIPQHLGPLPPPPPGATVVDRYHQPRQRVLVAFSGSLTEARMLLLHYVEAPRVLGQPITQPPENSGNLIVVHLDDEQRRAVIIGTRGGITDITGKPMTAGSGSDYAMGAMYAGQSAHRAVEIAAQLDVFTDHRVESILIAAAVNEPEDLFPFYLD